MGSPAPRRPSLVDHLATRLRASGHRLRWQAEAAEADGDGLVARLLRADAARAEGRAARLEQAVLVA
jgi:hypothetical protein